MIPKRKGPASECGCAYRALVRQIAAMSKYALEEARSLHSIALTFNYLVERARSIEAAHA